MDQLKSNNLISDQVIGVNLERASDDDPDGEISFGIVDNSKFSGQISYLPNVNTVGLWEVPVVCLYRKIN
jgi:cathepsin D